MFKQTAPVIKLSDAATESDYLGLIGVLNSSTACFWLKQVCHKKGGSPGSGGGDSDAPFTWSHAFNGTKVAQLPTPDGRPLERARRIDSLARELSACLPSAIELSEGSLRIARLQTEEI